MPVESPVSEVCVGFAAEDGRPAVRNVGPLVHSDRLALSEVPSPLHADWARDLDDELQIQPGDVESLSLPRARRKWKGLAQCVREAQTWLQARLPGFNLADAEVALMACRGARYHDDASRYGDAAFLNLFLSDDLGLEVHFPWPGLRVPLKRGTILLFDPAQPHAVVARGTDRFDAAHFTPERPSTQVFLTWELPIEHAGLGTLLGVRIEKTVAGQVGPQGLLRSGRAVQPCPETGRLLPS